MAVDIHSFTSNFKGGGARTNLFQVLITNPVDSSQDSIISFRCNAISLPAWQTQLINVRFMGRSIPYSGVRQFTPWTVHVMEDSDWMVRNALESWQNWINLQRENVRGFSAETDDQYKSVGKAQLLDKLGNLVREYSFFNIWPSDVGQIEMRWDNDTYVDYPVTFQYDYFEISGGSSGDAGEASANTATSS